MESIAMEGIAMQECLLPQSPGSEPADSRQHDVSAAAVSFVPHQTAHSSSHPTSHAQGNISRKKSKYLRGRHKSVKAAPTDVENEITEDILNDSDMMDGGQDGHTKRSEELRAQPIHLSMKRKIRRDLDERLTTPGTKMSTLKGGTLKGRFIKQSVSDPSSLFGLWDSHLKIVQGYFGTDVASYFLFLRWLFLSNLFTGVIILAFIIVPHAIYRYTYDYASNLAFSGVELLTGLGWFTETEMLYGGYANFSLPPVRYNMPLAYLSANFGYFLFFFLVIAVSLARSYRVNFIEGSGNLTFYYVQLVLGGWDYGISNPSTANRKKAHMLRELKEFLATVKAERDSDRNICVQLFLRVGLAAFQLLIIGLSGWGVNLMVLQEKSELIYGVGRLSDIYLVLLIAGLNILLPFLFSRCARYNRFQNEKNVVYSSLVMTTLLYGVTMGVFLYSELVACSDTIVTLQKNRACAQCWESSLGAKVYQLVILDFLLVVIVTVVTTGVRRLIKNWCWKSMDSPEFDIARNTVYLLYSQFLCWLGIYYSPILVVVAALKFFIFFYMNRYLVTAACSPSSRPWRAARMNTVFLVILFVEFLLCIAVLGLTIWVTVPSTTCGPFAGMEHAISILQKELAGPVSEDVLTIFFSPGFVVGLIIILCVAVHYTRVVSQGKKKLVQLLKEQIRLESKDRVFLQNLLETVQKEQVQADGTPGSESGSFPASPSRPISTDPTGPSSDGVRIRGQGGRVFIKQASALSLAKMEKRSTGALRSPARPVSTSSDGLRLRSSDPKQGTPRSSDPKQGTPTRVQQANISGMSGDATHEFTFASVPPQNSYMHNP